MKRSDLIPPPASTQEPGIRYGGKLIRDMTDEELAQCLPKAAQDHAIAQGQMQQAVMHHAAVQTIANVLAYEQERRLKKLQLAGADLLPPGGRA